MKHLSYNLRCLEEYGVNYLTGEACAYSLRVLCDVSKRGADLLRSFWGLPDGSTFYPNWNSKVNGEPAIGSVMFPRNGFPELIRFALIHVDGFDYALTLPSGEMIGLNEEDEECADYLKMARAGKWDVYTNWSKRQGGPRVGDRNVHAFSGRAA